MDTDKLTEIIVKIVIEVLKNMNVEVKSNTTSIPLSSVDLSHLKVISENNILSQFKSNTKINNLKIKKGTIITPLAKDFIQSHKINVEIY